MERGSMWKAIIGGLLALCGCGGGPEDPSFLARVGEVNITTGDLRSFAASLKSEGEEGSGGIPARDLLQTLIDRQLLLTEAQTRGLEEGEGVLERLQKHQTEGLIDEMLYRQIAAKFSISSQEVEQEFKRRGWESRIKSLEIFVSERSKAQEVIDGLAAGKDFGELGRVYAEDRLLKVPIGAPRSATYFPNDRPRELVDALFALPEGGHTSPILVGDGFIIAKVAERSKMELVEVEDRVVQSLTRLKKEALRDAYYISLQKRFALTLNQTGMDLVVRLLRGELPFEGLKEEERRLAVYSYDGGIVDVDAVYVAIAGKEKSWTEIDESRVAGELIDQLLPHTLMEQDARQQGLDQSDRFKRWIRGKKEDLMISRLRFEVLDEQLTISEEEIQARYEESRERFRAPAQARVLELLSEDAAQAQVLRGRIEAGEDMHSLVRAHSIRENVEEGILTVYDAQGPFYGEAWLNAVMKGPLDELGGPLKTKGGYSLFKVLERTPASYFTLENERVRRAVNGDIKRLKQRDLFNEFLQNLRRRYADKIEIYEENMERWEAARGTE